MKRVLVTGASGFIGRHLLPILAERGDWEVHALGRRSAGAPGVSWIEGDLLADDPRRLLDGLGITHLLHLAWEATPGKYPTAPVNLDWAAATLRLVRAFRECGGKRFVGVGTCAEYAPSERPLHEARSAIAPASVYAASKHAVRVAAEAYAVQEGMEFAWARLFFLYGAHEYPQRFVASVARALVAGVPARCSPGEQRRDFLLVDDMAAALAAILASDVSGPINVGSGTAHPIAEIARTIANLAGRPDLLQLGALPAPAHEPPIIVADVQRLNEEVGWTPRHTLEQGLRQTLEWWQLQGSEVAA